MTFIEAAIEVFNKNNNEELSCSEIFELIKDKIDSKGKTPKLSLNTILHRSELFLTISGNPDKFIYKRFVSENIKESLIENGFLTKEKLKEILEKNNINIII